MGKRPNTVRLRYGYNTAHNSAPDNTVQYGPKTSRFYTVYCRKGSVFTAFTVRFRVVNDAVLIDLGCEPSKRSISIDQQCKNQCHHHLLPHRPFSQKKIHRRQGECRWLNKIRITNFFVDWYSKYVFVLFLPLLTLRSNRSSIFFLCLQSINKCFSQQTNKQTFFFPIRDFSHFHWKSNSIQRKQRFVSEQISSNVFGIEFDQCFPTISSLELLQMDEQSIKSWRTNTGQQNDR
jgi:hypothetical protein